MADELLERLRALDGAEPTGVDPDRVALTVRTRRRSRYAVWGTVAALVTVVGAFVVVRPAPGPVPAGSGLTCPPSFVGPAGDWVPAGPTADTDGHLVPNESPVSAVACSYPAGDNMTTRPGPWPLARSRALTGLDRLARDLYWTPRDLGAQPCTAMGGPLTNQLLGLRYASGGVVWVAAQDEVNGCGAGGNGDTAYRVSAKLVADAVESGSWPAVDDGADCPARGGRYGDTEALVPGEPTSATVCLEGADTKVTSRPTAAETAQLLATVRGLRATRSDGSCGPSDEGSDQVRLVFHYEAGPPVVLHLWRQCRPGVMGRALAAQDPAALWSFLDGRYAVSSGAAASPGTSDAASVVRKYLELVQAGDCAGTTPVVADRFRENGDICGYLTLTGYDVPDAPMQVQDDELVFSVQLHGVHWTPGGAANDGEVTWFLTATRQADGMWRLTAGGSGP